MYCIGSHSANDPSPLLGTGRLFALISPKILQPWMLDYSAIKDTSISSEIVIKINGSK